MSIALVVPAWFGYVGTLDASQIVARGHGQAIEEGIIGRLRAAQVPPSESDLSEILEALEPFGLRYIEFGGQVLRKVGTARVDSQARAPRETGGQRFSHSGDRVRMEVRVPPPRGGPPRGRPPGPRSGPPHDGPPRPRAGPPRDGPPRPRSGPPRDGPPRPRSGPPRDGPPRPRSGPLDDSRRPGPRGPSLVFEYEPGPANQLVARARTSLIINCCAAGALLVAAWFAFLWLRRQEDSEIARTRERHLATLGEMSAVLAHEIRNPLASLKGHAQLLAESLRESPEKEHKANRVVKEAIRLETLTTDLLDFVRTGEIHPRRCNPATVLQQAAEDVGSDQIVLDIEQAPANCMMDGDRMQQALTNLIRNAAEASEGNVEASARRESGCLVFEVRDHGPGIASEELEHLFDAFHTTKVRGTGLGLAVVRRVVELHDGTVLASNHPGGGALFRIEIPGGK
ncbi:MAG: hypothetical protein GY811_21905 [Myxococcales bacterium]|nr:hypothetical protein [Myxococcales bacterium]